MKENEQNLSTEQTTFMKAATDLPRSVWLSEPKEKGRGLELQTLSNMFFMTITENGTNREPSGAELAERYQSFRFKKRLDGFMKSAFEDLENAYPDPEQKPSCLNHILVDGQTPDQLWGEKYATVTDPVQKYTMYQLELMREITAGNREITATDPTQPEAQPAQILPGGNRTPIRRPAQPQSAPEEEEIMFDEPEEAPEAAPEAAPEEPSHRLTGEDVTGYANDAYRKLHSTNPNLGIAMQPYSMVSIMMNNRTGDEIAAVYPTLPYKDMLDTAIADSTGLFDSPERTALLQSGGINPMDTIHIDGQTPAQIWGEKYKNVQDPALKNTFYKMEMMRALGDPKGNHEISVDLYEKQPDGTLSKQPSVSAKLNKELPKTERVYDPDTFDYYLGRRQRTISTREPFPDDRWKPEQPKDPVPIDRSPRKAEDTLEQVEANWEMVTYVNNLHQELAESYKKLSESHKEVLGVSSKDTKLFNNMMEKLKDCLKYTDPEDGRARPVQMGQYLKDFQKAAAVYYKDRKGILFGPTTDVGKLRLKEAKNAAETLDGKIAKLNELNKKVHPQKFQKFALWDIAERAIIQGELLGKDLDTDKLPGTYNDTFREWCADRVLEGELKQRNKTTSIWEQDKNPLSDAEIYDMKMDLSLNNEFINVVQHYPRHFEQKWKETKVALDYLAKHDNKNPGWNEITDLIENPEFVAACSKHPNEMPEFWDSFQQAKEYLHQTGAADRSTEATMELADDYHFQEVCAAHPEDFVTVWRHTAAAREVLPENTKRAEINALAQDPYFISVCDRFPESYASKWNLIEKARNCLDEKAFKTPEARNAAAENLAQNPAFLTVLSDHPDTYQKEWDHFVKAKAYLQEKTGAEPTTQDCRKLAEDPVFAHTVEKDPQSYGSSYVQLLSDAETIVQKAKEQLEDMTSDLEDTPLWKCVRDDYSRQDVTNDAYEKGMEALAEKKEDLKEERFKLFDEKEKLQDEPSDELSQKVAEDQAKLDHETALYKAGKQMLVNQHLLPDYIAKITLYQALADPSRGNDISRAIAAEPKQQDAILAHTKQFLKTEEGQQLMKDPNLKEMLQDGSLSQKLIGKNKTKPEMKQNKELEKAPSQKGMGL